MEVWEKALELAKSKIPQKQKEAEFQKMMNQTQDEDERYAIGMAWETTITPKR